MTTVQVRVDTKLLDQLKKAVGGELADSELASAAAEAAYFHATAMLGSLPQAVAGKLNVTYSADMPGSAQVHYEPKAGAEGSTIQLPKGGRGAIFIPLDRLGGYSKRNPTMSSGGTEGIFVSRVANTGRPSIQNYLMNQVNTHLAGVDAVTAEWATQKAVEDLKLWFQRNGIVWNAGAERYQTTHTTILPTGSTVPSGRFVVGEF